jgi:hypothetical protein
LQDAGDDIFLSISVEFHHQQPIAFAIGTSQSVVYHNSLGKSPAALR